MKLVFGWLHKSYEMTTNIRFCLSYDPGLPLSVKNNWKINFFFKSEKSQCIYVGNDMKKSQNLKKTYGYDSLWKKYLLCSRGKIVIYRVWAHLHPHMGLLLKGRFLRKSNFSFKKIHLASFD